MLSSYFLLKHDAKIADVIEVITGEIRNRVAGTPSQRLSQSLRRPVACQQMAPGERCRCRSAVDRHAGAAPAGHAKHRLAPKHPGSRRTNRWRSPVGQRRELSRHESRTLPSAMLAQGATATLLHALPRADPFRITAQKRRYVDVEEGHRDAGIRGTSRSGASVHESRLSFRYFQSKTASTAPPRIG